MPSEAEDRDVLTHGSLFAGKAGFDRGFEQAGIETKWQIEINDDRRRELEYWFPGCKRYTDVRKWREYDLERVDIISAGVPCQPSSRAGRQLFTADERWLWDTTIKIIGALDSKVAVLENPPGVLDGGIGKILGALAEIGRDALWFPVWSASSGAPDLRERLIILAYPAGIRLPRSWARWEPMHSTPDAYREADQLVHAVQGDALPYVCGRHPRFPRRMVESCLEGYGNAFNPQIATWLGRNLAQFLESET